MEEVTTSVERQMVADVIDCDIPKFVELMRSVDVTTLLGMQGVLRVQYKQVELAHQDLAVIINDKDSYTEAEANLFKDQILTMMNIEEKTRLVTQEIEVTKDQIKLMD
jgi:hypothetical protein